MTQFAGKLVYAASGLKAFNGTTVATISPNSGCSSSVVPVGPAATVNPGDGYYYMLANMCNGQYVLRTADLTTWYTMTGDISGHNFTSMDVSGGNAYLGTSDSKVYSVALVQAATPLGGGTTSTSTSTPSTTRKCKALKCR